MSRRADQPASGDRRAVALDDSGLLRGTDRRDTKTGTLWALEQYNGMLWTLEGISTDEDAAARFVDRLDPVAATPRRRWLRRNP